MSKTITIEFFRSIGLVSYKKANINKPNNKIIPTCKAPSGFSAIPNISGWYKKKKGNRNPGIARRIAWSAVSPYLPPEILIATSTARLTGGVSWDSTEK